jgi:hypothetical protein
MTRRLRAFFVFWYDFIVGEDWRIAVGVALALAATYGLSTTTIPSWWVLPAAVAILLPASLWRAEGHRRAEPDTRPHGSTQSDR